MKSFGTYGSVWKYSLARRATKSRRTGWFTRILLRSRLRLEQFPWICKNYKLDLQKHPFSAMSIRFTVVQVVSTISEQC